MSSTPGVNLHKHSEALHRAGDTVRHSAGRGETQPSTVRAEGVQGSQGRRELELSREDLLEEAGGLDVHGEDSVFCSGPWAAPAVTVLME